MSNGNAPTLKKAGPLYGKTVDISTLDSDLIQLGAAEDLDGDVVTVTFSISPSTDFVTFDAETNTVELISEALFKDAGNSSKKYKVKVVARDQNPAPRSTEYDFTLFVPSLTDEAIGAYFAKLIMSRKEGESEEIDPDLPQIDYMQVSTDQKLTIFFTEPLLTKEPEKITADVL